jgi:predicted nuclease of predicted toxin-antitoxin system
LRLLLDEMYPPALAADLQAVGIDAVSIYELGMAGTADPDLFAYAVADDRALLTENVADFVAIAAQHSSTGKRHPGLLIALSNRFSRRPSGHRKIVDAVAAHQAEELEDRIIYMSPTG